MPATMVLAALGGLAAATATAVTTGDASAALGLAHAAPPGLQVALSHVPVASQAHQVLTQHLSLYAQAGGAGTVGAGGAAGALKHGLHLGLGK